MKFPPLLKLTCCLDNQVVMVACYSLTAAASNPEMVNMLLHVRGQGVMDLEFESDGGCGTLVCLLLLPHYPSCPSVSLDPNPLFFLPLSLSSVQNQ